MDADGSSWQSDMSNFYGIYYIARRTGQTVIAAILAT